MNDLDTLVYAVMRDPDLSPHDRAQEAVEHIEYEITAEFGLVPGTPLPIPLEWEHRIPAPQTVVHRSEGPALVLDTDYEDLFKPRKWWPWS